MAGFTLPPIHSVHSGLTKVLARRSASAGQAARPPDPLLAPSAPSSAPRAHARTRGPDGARPSPSVGASHAALRATWSPEGDSTLGVEGAQGWRHRQGPGAGHQRLGMAARRVAHGQAQGMKGSLSSGDTGAVSSGLPLPRP